MKHPLNDITASELKEKIEQGQNLNILDVRELIEYHTFNIGGLNVPLGILSRDLETVAYNKEDEIVVVCQRGLRSETARRILASAGFTNVKNLYGGLLAYKRIKE